MNRRGFFGLLAAAAVVPLVPMPELDVGRRIFLPPRGGWLSSGLIGRYSGGDTYNVLLSVEQIARESLRVFRVETEFSAIIAGRPVVGLHPGAFTAPKPINIRRPERYGLKVGDLITIEGIH